MNLVSLYYFVEIAKERSISKTAKRMHITQQALSLHVKKLEDSYGTALFIRKPSLTLTYTGELLYEAAEKMLLINTNVMKQIHEAEDKNAGQLKIGASANILAECLPEVIRRFRCRWPGVKLQINMNSFDSEIMEKQLEDGTLDLFIWTRLVSVSDLNRLSSESSDICMYTERMYLVVPKLLIEHHFASKAEEVVRRSLSGVSMKDFENIPFVLLREGKSKRTIANELFAKAGFSPVIAMEVANSEQITPLLPLNLGAFFCDGIRINSFLEHHRQDYYTFPIHIDEYHMSRVLCIETDVRHYQEVFALDFVAVVKQVFDEMYGKPE